MASSVVPTGRRMKGSEMFMPLLRRPLGGLRRLRQVELGLQLRRWAEPRLHALHRQVDDRGRIEREQLAQQQAADDGDAERVAQLRAGAALEGERNGAEQGRERGHHDRAEAQQRCLHDRVARREPLVALGFQREVDHHDRVLLHDAHQQHDADQRHHREILLVVHQRQQGADAGGRQRGQDRERVDEAFVEHAEHDVDRDRRRQDEPGLASERLGELRGVAGIAADHR